MMAADRYYQTGIPVRSRGAVSVTDDDGDDTNSDDDDHLFSEGEEDGLNDTGGEALWA